MEWLTKILEGVEGAEELAKKIQKGIGESFIARSDFNDKNEELKKANARIGELEKTIKETGGEKETITKLQNDLTAANTKYETDTKALNEKISKIQSDFVLDSEIGKLGVNSVKATKAVLNMDTIKITDGKVEGLEDQVKELKKTSPWLFATSSGGRRQGYEPDLGEPGGGGDNKSLGKRLAESKKKGNNQTSVNKLFGIGTSEE